VELGDRRLFGEPFGPARTLVVAGAGHVGRALAGLGRFLGLRVVVLDDRAEYATRQRFPDADEVHAAPVAETLGQLAVHGRTAVVVAMRNQDLDFEATRAALRSPARYVGLIGARRKAVLLAERLRAAGLPPERIRALRAPVGLDLGARTPEEIALSILSEWLMLREGASGAALRLDDAGPAGGTGRVAPSPPSPAALAGSPGGPGA
jgi:xanthine dehydrogenase accessory factor